MRAFRSDITQQNRDSITNDEMKIKEMDHENGNCPRGMNSDKCDNHKSKSMKNPRVNEEK